MTDVGRPKDFHQRWPSLKPPLRPDPHVVAQMTRLLPDIELPVLQLGVTPEIADVGSPKIAMDWSEKMIATAWPGDTSSRRAVLGNWLDMAFEDNCFAAVIGDGPVTMLLFPQQAARLFDRLRAVIAPGGLMIFRCFATPDNHPTLQDICSQINAGIYSFHEAKLRFNMAAARELGEGGFNIASQTLFALFETAFPDRPRLSSQTGWSLQTLSEIDAYRESSYVHCYPSREEVETVLGKLNLRAGWAETTGYPGAELCPLLIVDMP